MANPVSQLKDDHRVIIGSAIVVIGIIGAAASLTGTLAAAIAALFDPLALTSKSSAGISGSVPLVPAVAPGGDESSPPEGESSPPEIESGGSGASGLGELGDVLSLLGDAA